MEISWNFSVREPMHAVVRSHTTQITQVVLNCRLRQHVICNACTSSCITTISLCHQTCAKPSMPRILLVYYTEIVRKNSPILISQIRIGILTLILRFTRFQCQIILHLIYFNNWHDATDELLYSVRGTKRKHPFWKIINK